MSTLPAVRSGGAITQVDLAPEIVEKVLVGGDLSKLDAKQRLAYYHARCDAAGLDPRTKPFEYITLQGKLTLYALKSCTDSLCGIHGLTVEVRRHKAEKDSGIYVAEARVTFPSGRYADDIGVTPIKGLGPVELCNAMMKAVTKAKRRAVLSACGLGDVIDESELETTTPSHHASHHDNNTGHGSGAYAPPKVVAEYKQWLSDFVSDVNAKWLDRLTSEDGQIDPRARELLSTWQVSGHLVKWAVADGLINAPDEPRSRQYDQFAAVAWDRNRGALIEEAESYGRRKWKEERQRLASSSEPELIPAEDLSQDEADPDIDTEPREPGSDG